MKQARNEQHLQDKLSMFNCSRLNIYCNKKLNQKKIHKIFKHNLHILKKILLYYQIWYYIIMFSEGERGKGSSLEELRTSEWSGEWKCPATATSLAARGSVHMMMIMMMDHIELWIEIGAQFLLRPFSHTLLYLLFLSVSSLSMQYFFSLLDDKSGKSALKSESFFVTRISRAEQG